jgi:hypothetical protein
MIPDQAPKALTYGINAAYKQESVDPQASSRALAEGVVIQKIQAKTGLLRPPAFAGVLAMTPVDLLLPE